MFVVVFLDYAYNKIMYFTVFLILYHVITLSFYCQIPLGATRFSNSLLKFAGVSESCVHVDI